MKNFLALIYQTEMPGWAQLAQFGPTVILLALILMFLIRVAPVWKEIKLKELDVRETEADGRKDQAGALSQLAGALKDIAVEQRRATENVQILQRVNADAADRLTGTVERLSDRVQEREEQCGNCHDLVDRVEKLERGVAA